MGTRLVALSRNVAGVLLGAVVGRSLAGIVGRAVAVAAMAPVIGVLLSPPKLAGLVALGAAVVVGGAAGVGAFIGVRRAFRDVQAVLEQAQQGKVVRGSGSTVVEVRQTVGAVAELANEYRASVDELQFQAFHDPLTGLPNRAHFLAALREALRGTDEGEPVAVLLFDLDRFKVINDSLGHGVGDRLLVVLTQRLRRLEAPNRMLARLAGDEFVLLIRGRRAESEALWCANAIIEACRRPCAVEGHDLMATASVGIAVGMQGRDTAHELLRRADIALYRAKEAGRARYALFDPAREEPTAERLSLESGLRRAVDRGQLRLVYQPVYRLVDGALAGFEALLRWHHPHRGVLPPAAFIGLAEESGEILAIGRWVLGEAARQAALFARHCSRASAPVTVWVNLSAVEFAEPALVRRVEATLREVGADPSWLGVETTETVLMRDIGASSEALAALRSLGVRAAIDDFGTGYSSLAYLELLPVDCLKVDAAFIGSLERSERAAEIVKSIVGLAQSLGLAVTAEGVETRRQLQFLRAIGCGYAQGHYFAPAMSGERALELVNGVALRRAR